MQRTIPAHAGEPNRDYAIVRIAGDYPRACGGTLAAAAAATPVMGLSPRMRGNLDGAHRPGNIGGTIPAHAGEPPVYAETV